MHEVKLELSQIFLPNTNVSEIFALSMYISIVDI